MGEGRVEGEEVRRKERKRRRGNGEEGEEEEGEKADRGKEKERKGTGRARQTSGGDRRKRRGEQCDGKKGEKTMLLHVVKFHFTSRHESITQEQKHLPESSMCLLSRDKPAVDEVIVTYMYSV